MHLPLICEQLMQEVPRVPQAVCEKPDWHWPLPSQQPAQLVALHDDAMHEPPEESRAVHLPPLAAQFVH